MIVETIEWHTFHPRFINSDSVILDLGANLGRFSHSMIKRFGCRCYAVEASPDIYDRIEPNNLLHTFNFAVCNTNGIVRFNISENSEGSSIIYSNGVRFIRHIEIRGKHLEGFVNEIGLSRIDLLKFDIEGAEIKVIDSCSDDFFKNKVSQMTIEFHDFCDITKTQEIKRIFSRFNEIGFFSVRMSKNSYQDTFFLNQKLCYISPLECLWLRYFVRNWTGLMRILNRTFLLSRKNT
jgi:FkbM family methyltransferase